MHNRIRLAVVAGVIALGAGSASVGLASATPTLPGPGIGATADADTHFTYIRNAGTVVRAATSGSTVTLTLTAFDHASCGSGVIAGTADEVIAQEDSSSLVRPVDIPGPDLFDSTSASLHGNPSFPDIPADEESPVVKTAPLPAGHYTALAYCSVYSDAGDLTTTSVNTYYLEEFTLPSATAPVRFGS